jgi:hypothetical protein
MRKLRGVFRTTGGRSSGGARSGIHKQLSERNVVSRHRDQLDTQPGSVPEITEHVDGLTFVMRPRGMPKTEKLVIRSDDAGDIWVAIASDCSRDA